MWEIYKWTYHDSSSNSPTISHFHLGLVIYVRICKNSSKNSHTFSLGASDFFEKLVDKLVIFLTVTHLQAELDFSVCNLYINLLLPANSTPTDVANARKSWEGTAQWAKWSVCSGDSYLCSPVHGLISALWHLSSSLTLYTQGIKEVFALFLTHCGATWLATR